MQVLGRKRHTRIQGMVVDFDEQLHTFEEVFGCGLLVGLFCFSVLGCGCFGSL